MSVPTLILVMIAGVIVAGFVCVIILHLYLKSKEEMERRRRVALMVLADHLGFDFTPYDRFRLPAMFSHLSIFSTAFSTSQSRWVKNIDYWTKNIVYGEREGASVYIFECGYGPVKTVTDGEMVFHVGGYTKKKRRQSYSSFTVCCVRTAMDFPYLWIGRERFFDKLASFMGFDDIDFESNEFSKQFYVKSESKKFAYEVINQKTMEFLLSSPAKPYVEIYRHSAVAYFVGREPPASPRYLYLYEFIFRLLDCIPDFVLEKYRRA